jgi:hypothetical protein
MERCGPVEKDGPPAGEERERERERRVRRGNSMHREKASLESTFFSVDGYRTGRQIHRRQNAGEGWPDGGWPTTETEADRREGRSRPVSEQARERERETR